MLKMMSQDLGVGVLIGKLGKYLGVKKKVIIKVLGPSDLARSLTYYRKRDNQSRHFYYDNKR